MEELKAKMAAAADKAKAARAMKKEEIAAAIADINADIDALDAALAEDYATFDADMKAEIDDTIATVDGEIAAAEENIKMVKDRRNSKIYALKLKAQMKAEALKDKIADKRAERDKAAMENYIVDLLNYAQYCQEIALAAAIEADMTLLEAAEVAADYVEKYGEPEVEEPEAAEAE